LAVPLIPNIRNREHRSYHTFQNAVVGVGEAEEKAEVREGVLHAQ